LASAIRVGLVAAGLSALPASSAVALNVIRWAGVIYLSVLGVRASRKAQKRDARVVGGVPVARSVRSGLLVGLGNPKLVIFFLSSFPQFVQPRRGSELVQILALGAIFWVIGAIWDVAFALAAGSIGTWLRRRPGLHAATPRLEGVAYLGPAGWSALSGTRSAP